MKKYILLIIVFLLIGCDSQNNSILPNNSGITDAKIVEIDGCEYIQYHVYYYEAITHKGNCKYCMMRNKK